MKHQFAATKATTIIQRQLSDEQRNQVLADLAAAIEDQMETLLSANQQDLAKMNTEDPLFDRLQLTESRLQDIAQSLHQLADMPSPLGQVLEERTRPNGLQLRKISVPLGVIGMIYEARPNVTFDVFALCFKSGNSCVLRGGSAAYYSNKAIVELIQSVLAAHKLPLEIICMASPDRESVRDVIEAVGIIDVIIPRGSQNLINFVRDNSKVPVIETGAGIVHTYIAKSADLELAKKVIHNAKTRRPSVCNSLDAIVLHEDHLAKLPTIMQPMAESRVEVFADELSQQILKNNYPTELLKPAARDSFGTEFLSLKLAIKVVKDFAEAVEHISQYTSGHSEAIISTNQEEIEQFFSSIDAAAIYANTSTAFTDGGEFGFGAEIGISTQKLHARGPMGLPELTSYQWQVKGEGQIRT